MAGFLTTLYLYKKQPIIYKELTLKEYKNILKSLLSDPIDTDSILLNLNRILINITSLKEEELINLNLLEYLALLVNIRQVSIGNSIFATYKTETDNINIEINLQETFDEIINCLKKDRTIIINDNNINLKLSIPKIKNLLNKNDNLYCDQNINDLPAKYFAPINNKINTLNKQINNFYFFKSPIEKYSIKLSLKLIDYFQLIKILFNDNLLTIYNNIFYLSKICHLTPDYLENSTYGEFKIFVKKVQEMSEQSASNTNNQSEVDSDANDFDPVDIDSLYGNENEEPPSNITRSEFTP
jgi:hypothetical protein